ncbi:MAG TPA: hypothetical protein VI997_08695 [Candidatus Thermoplasmatota archaeon]|nr:hypothetical protein [Candidatus Thermoplasmatota archaeon]
MRGGRTTLTLTVTAALLAAAALPAAEAVLGGSWLFDDPTATAQDLLVVLAVQRGDAFAPLPIPGRDVPASADWTAAILGLYAAGGLRTASYDVAALRAQSTALDDRLETALVPLVDSMAAAVSASTRGDHVAAALLLLDVTDAARPQLLALPPEAWPATTTSDPLGIVGVGSLDADVHTQDHWLLVDAGGDDEWANNAGGACGFCPEFFFDPFTWVVRPVALAWDLDGNDMYVPSGLGVGFAQGGSATGVGVMLDDSGNDSYTCNSDCQGGTQTGVSLFRDALGDDHYWATFNAQGAALNGISVFLEESGDDTYRVQSDGQAATGLRGAAVMRDADGADQYNSSGTRARGLSSLGGQAHFRDFGADLDLYQHIGADNAAWTNQVGGGAVDAGDGIDQ